MTACADGALDVRSTAFATAKERSARLCEAVLCPSTPDDAAFHVTREARIFGEAPLIVRAVVKVPAADVVRWARGCEPKGADARPPWLPALLEGTGWAPMTAPDTVRCGREVRRVHVRDGLVVLSQEPR